MDESEDNLDAGFERLLLESNDEEEDAFDESSQIQLLTCPLEDNSWTEKTATTTANLKATFAREVMPRSITDGDLRTTVALEKRSLKMSLVQMPNLRCYWSTDMAIGGHSIAGKITLRTRFESFLRFLHLADNERNDGRNRLHKVSKLVELFNIACQKAFRPGEQVCTDESLVPFRGRIIFKQYMPAK
ncbi:hypothetical protein OESDEN_01001 [Oesophagostomum dentatum]|uniref:PiggyBac transposable element-derived protein domain-containing protein n=1 Tax=Oesophagostomum dentatum TaxID=61180 RepID=A0A0B1TSC1_OESDE|nr:hypothetical protein OESDEN_01001 [Oesophagostomum dentatum]